MDTPTYMGLMTDRELHDRGLGPVLHCVVDDTSRFLLPISSRQIDGRISSSFFPSNRREDFYFPFLSLLPPASDVGQWWPNSNVILP